MSLIFIVFTLTFPEIEAQLLYYVTFEREGDFDFFFEIQIYVYVITQILKIHVFIRFKVIEKVRVDIIFIKLT